MIQEDIEKFEKPKVLNPKLIKRGIIIFIVITIITFLGIFFYTNTGNTVEVWQMADWRYLLLGLVFIFNDLFLGGLRNHIFIRQFVPGISQMVSIKANLANIFMGAITPSQSGGGPAQWYIFYRNGVALSDIIGTTLYNWVSTIIFFPISGYFALRVLQDKMPDGFILYLTQFGFSVFTSLLVVIGIALFAPAVIQFIINSIANALGRIKASWGDRLSRLGVDGIAKIKEYKGKYVGLIQKKPHLMLFSFLLTVALYFNKYLLAYVLVLAFGLTADFWTVIAIQAVLYLLLYFSPSPGGSGIAEVSISVLMATVIATDFIAPFTLLYRSFLIFIPALIGSYVILNQSLSHIIEEVPQRSTR